jgi:signal transduction histidine kinase
MARPPVYTAIAGAFAVTLLALIGVGIGSYDGMWDLVDSRVQVEHTYDVLRAVDAVSTRVASAESGVRGYVITGDERYLTRHDADTAEAWRSLATLERLTTENLRQRQRARALAPLVRERLGALDAAMERRRGLATAPDTAAAERWSPAGDSLRALLGIIAAEEDVVRRQRSSNQARSIVSTAVAMVLVLLLSTALAALATLAVRRDIAARARVAEELLRAKEAAEAASRSKSDFLATMSHELRTPLNSVIGFSNVLLKNKTGNLSSQDLSYLARIAANGTHLLTLINDVLDLSKVEAGHMELQRVPVSLASLVSETLAEFEAQGRERYVALRAVLPPDAAPVTTDPVRLRQVLVNLVGNALKFTRHGSVTVRVEVDRTTRVPVRLSVVDTGDGIPDDRQQAIFNAFEQADSGTARRYGGTGLGLTIARSLCELLGYRLELTSSKVGIGSVFSVVLASGDDAVEAVDARPRDAGTLPAGYVLRPREPGATTTLTTLRA